MTTLPTPRERPWLTITEVAQATGEGEKAIRAALDAGHLPELRIGRYRRIPTAAFYALVGLSPPDVETAPPARGAAEVESHHPDGASTMLRVRQPDSSGQNLGGAA